MTREREIVAGDAVRFTETEHWALDDTLVHEIARVHEGMGWVRCYPLYRAALEGNHAQFVRVDEPVDCMSCLVAD